MHVDPEYEAAWQPFSTLPKPMPNSALELRRTNNAAISTVMTLFPHQEYADISQTALTYTSTDGTQQTMLRFDPTPRLRANNPPGGVVKKPPTTTFPRTGTTTTTTTLLNPTTTTIPTLPTVPTLSTPGPPTPTPAILYIHGGGLVSGSSSLFRKDIIRYARATNLPLFAPAYRLAPEHPYPTPLNDVCAALAHLRTHAGQLNIDASRIAVLGFSSGGGLAAGLVVREMEAASGVGMGMGVGMGEREMRVKRESLGWRGGVGGGVYMRPPPVARLVLLAPMLDDRTWLGEGHPLSQHLTWTSAMNLIAWVAYLPERFGADGRERYVPPEAAAGRAKDVGGFPPTYLEVGGLDLFRDEVLAFGARLAAANVEVEMHLYPGVPHAWEWVAAEAEVTKRAVENRVRWMNGL